LANWVSTYLYILSVNPLPSTQVSVAVSGVEGAGRGETLKLKTLESSITAHTGLSGLVVFVPPAPQSRLELSLGPQLQSLSFDCSLWLPSVVCVFVL
jgi:hypothetical protein